MTLPDTADGTILTTTNPKAGNIIQVVSATKTDLVQVQLVSYVDTDVVLECQFQLHHQVYK